jgi:PTH1 family peptidyl-tRNA hydrolase
MHVLIGLGNPGATYEKTRHNVGFFAIDALAQAYHFPAFTLKPTLSYSEGRIGSQKVTLLKPLSFMNRSGIPVASYLSFYKISLDHVLVFHDDLDLALGRMKLKTGGGSGGHNGLKSLDQHIGPGYHRCRIGIDRPPAGHDVASYVLQNFTVEQRHIIDDRLIALTAGIDLFFQGRTDLLMTHLAEANNP